MREKSMRKHESVHYKKFFAHHIRKFIDQHIYKLEESEKIFELIQSIDTHTARRWEKLPLSYLSPSETLSLAMVIAFDQGGARLSNDKTFNKVQDYFHWTLEHNQKNLNSLASTGLGVIYFEKALNEERVAQRKWIRLAKYALETSTESIEKTQKTHVHLKHLEINYLYLTLAHVCLGELPSALSYLHKAAKISKNSAPLWRMLANIYKNLGQKHISKFFFNRYLKAMEGTQNSAKLSYI